MKTLINKTNPQIRITAPEEAVKERPSCWAIWPEGYKGYRSLLLDKDNWTLVEEEQPEEICSKCIYHKKDDGYCYYPHGGMKRRINENGVYECTEFWEKEQENHIETRSTAEWSEEDEKNIGKLHRLLVICQSEKKFIPTSEYEKLDKWLKSLKERITINDKNYDKTRTEERN